MFALRSDPSDASADYAEDDPTLQDACIPPNVVVGVLDFAERRGLNTESWLAGMGFTRPQLELAETRLSFRQAAAILGRALRALPAGPIGIDVGSRDVYVSWGLLGFALRSAESVAAAIDIGLRLHQASGSMLNYQFERCGGEFALRLDERSPDPRLYRFLCEDACSSIFALIRSAFGNEVAPTRLEFAYSRPVYAATYSAVFPVPIRYDAPATRIYFGAALLDRRIPTANPAQLGIVLEAVGRIAAPGELRPDIVASVEGLLRQNLRRPPAMPVVAGQLMISERTLYRRLAEAGQRYGDIRDRVRMQRARVLLRESRLPVTAVAAEVGFSDTREFRRAYQRWTGRTPSAERA